MTQPLDLQRPPSSEFLVCDDGEPMESARHRHQMNVLIESLEDALRDRDDFYVGGNMFLYFSPLQARKNDFRGPDVFVVLNTTRRERRAWVVWEEDGKTPDVIIELLSEKTQAIDRGEKMHVYGKQLKVGEYFLFDPFTSELLGFQLDPRSAGYVPKTPDRRGRLCCHQLGLYLGTVEGELHGTSAPWLRWLDQEGNVLSLPVERANAEAQRANAEAQRANAEAQRANAEAQRANAEAQRALRAHEEATRVTAENAALRAELERLDRPR